MYVYINVHINIMYKIYIYICIYIHICIYIFYVCYRCKHIGIPTCTQQLLTQSVIRPEDGRLKRRNM